MDAQELRNLQEAYLEVVKNQQLDEAERPIYGRGGALRRTQTSLQVLGKHATARDKKTKHNIPKGGTTIDKRDSGELMSGEYDRGKGSKAAKRAAALKKPEPKKSFPNRLRRSDGQGIRDSYDYYDIILSHLLDEGYAETPEAAEALNEISDRIVAAVGRRRQANVDKFMNSNEYTSDTPGATQKLATNISKLNRFKNLEKKRRRRSSNEQVDLYDIILSHLLDEGYAETPEAAEVIMVNMSEEWRESIIG